MNNGFNNALLLLYSKKKMQLLFNVSMTLSISLQCSTLTSEICYLTLDYFLWGYLKQVYANRSNLIPELEVRINRVIHHSTTVEPESDGRVHTIIRIMLWLLKTVILTDITLTNRSKPKYNKEHAHCEKGVMIISTFVECYICLRAPIRFPKSCLANSVFAY